MLIAFFYSSDWTLDVTYPGVDADDGWQYAPSFDTPDDQWTADVPIQLERALTGSGMVAAGLSNPQRNFSRGRRLSGSPLGDSTSYNWVRRRRWVRVMRRRIDIPPMPFMEPDGNFYHLLEDGELVRFVEDVPGDEGEGSQELVSMSKFSSSHAQDYVSRARYLVGNQSPDADGEVLSAVDARRAIAKLERATTELRDGITGKPLRTFTEIILPLFRS